MSLLTGVRESCVQAILQNLLYDLNPIESFDIFLWKEASEYIPFPTISVHSATGWLIFGT